MGGNITKVKTVDLEIGKCYTLNMIDNNGNNGINDNNDVNNDNENLDYTNIYKKEMIFRDDIILEGILVSKKQCKRGPYGGQEPMYTLVFRSNNIDKEIIKKWDYYFEEVTIK